MDDLDSRLVRQSAPTLAGLKAGSLFCCDASEEESLEEHLLLWNHAMNSKGVFAKKMRRHSGFLVYVYRRDLLERLLVEKEIAKFLSAFGYENFRAENALRFLEQRVQMSAEFPHEIGIFLGYPLEDVREFIAKAGKGCKQIGCWIVYHNEAEANRLFVAIQKCSALFFELLKNGFSLSSLTVQSHFSPQLRSYL